LLHKPLKCSLYIYIPEYERMGFISFSVYWSKYICLRLFLLNQFPLVSKKLSSSVPVQCLSEQLPQSQYLVLAAPVQYLSRQLLQLDILFICSSSVFLHCNLSCFLSFGYFSCSYNMGCFHFITSCFLYYQSCSWSPCYVN